MNDIAIRIDTGIELFSQLYQNDERLFSAKTVRHIVEICERVCNKIQCGADAKTLLSELDALKLVRNRLRGVYALRLSLTSSVTPYASDVESISLRFLILALQDAIQCIASEQGFTEIGSRVNNNLLTLQSA